MINRGEARLLSYLVIIVGLLVGAIPLALGGARFGLLDILIGVLLAVAGFFGLRRYNRKRRRPST